jgi:hypothetical protein
MYTFIDNKYKKIYDNIINRAKSRMIDGYTEKHHIIPKSLGGSDNSDNLVHLTAKEHFVCHLLLTKMVIGMDRSRMCYAAWQMTHINGRERYIPSGNMYALLRKNLSESLKGIPKTYTIWLGKKHSDKSKQKQSMVKLGKNNPMFGRKQSDDTINRIKSAQVGVPKPKFTCENCGKVVGGKSNLLRWHGDKCKGNQNY